MRALVIGALALLATSAGAQSLPDKLSRATRD